MTWITKVNTIFKRTLCKAMISHKQFDLGIHSMAQIWHITWRSFLWLLALSFSKTYVVGLLIHSIWSGKIARALQRKCSFFCNAKSIKKITDQQAIFCFKVSRHCGKNSWIGHMMLWQLSVTLLQFDYQWGRWAEWNYNVCTFGMTHVTCTSDCVDWVIWSGLV